MLFLFYEARVGIEPAYNSFAENRLTTWLPGQNYRLYFFLLILLKELFHSNSFASNCELLILVLLQPCPQ